MPNTTGGILAGIMLSALIPLLLLQSAIYLIWYRTRIQTEMNANLEFARSVAASFESYVQDIHRQLSVLGSALEIDPDFHIERAGKLLFILKNRYSTVIRFSMIDEKGVVVASTSPEIVGISTADQDYVRALKSGKEWTISDLNKGPLSKGMQFVIATKFRTNAGSDASLAAVIDPAKLGKLELSLDRLAGGVFIIFDRSGTLVFYSGNASIPHSNWGNLDAVLQKAMGGVEAVGTIRNPLGNKEHVVARVPINNIGWIAGAGRAVDTVMAPIYRNLLWVAILNGAILLVSIAGALVLRRFFIGKLGKLREHARLIAGGEFTSRADVGNPVELAELEKSFNVMAGQIQARQDALQRAVTDLTRSNQELEQFAYVASHDLQEPLRVITGFVQLIEKKYKGRLDNDADRYIGFITDAVHRQQELIRDLLMYSRFGRQEIRLVPTDCIVAIDAAAQNMRQIIEDTKATVTYNELPVVQADRLQLVQLFQNLIHNGIKFRGQEPPVIQISAQPENGTWIIAVRDNGIGIESQYWSQIFTMFKRLHTRKDYPGTGIGLAICKKIVERHGGRIWLDSKPGEGSTFFFTLKAAGEQ